MKLAILLMLAIFLCGCSSEPIRYIQASDGTKVPVYHEPLVLIGMPPFPYGNYDYRGKCPGESHWHYEWHSRDLKCP